MKTLKLKQSEKEKYLKVIYDAWNGIGDFKFKKYADLPVSLWDSAGFSWSQDYDWSAIRDSSDEVIRRLYIICLSRLNYSNKKIIVSRGKAVKTNKKENK